MTSPLLQAKKNTINREKRIEILRSEIRTSRIVLNTYMDRAMELNEEIKIKSKELKELES